MFSTIGMYLKCRKFELYDYKWGLDLFLILPGSHELNGQIEGLNFGIQT